MNLLTSSLILLLALAFIAWSKPKKDSFRFFSSMQKNIIWERSKGKCELCGIKLVPFKGRESSFEADHILAWSKGGKTTLSNAQALCKKCNRKKSNN